MKRALVFISLAIIAAALAAPLVLRAVSQPHIFASVTDIRADDAAIVLGASVVHGTPSPVLAFRADGAVALYRAGAISKILVTGDGADKSYDEVTPTYEYLTNAGIPTSSIMLDPAGLDTYSSLYRAVHTYHIMSAVIVTQDFHLPRAVFIARMLGMDASGLEVPGGNSMYDYLREIPASLKALFDIVVHRVVEGREM